jgi:hypothetical protein
MKAWIYCDIIYDYWVDTCMREEVTLRKYIKLAKMIREKYEKEKAAH